MSQGKVENLVLTLGQARHDVLSFLSEQTFLVYLILYLKYLNRKKVHENAKQLHCIIFKT